MQRTTSIITLVIGLRLPRFQSISSIFISEGTLSIKSQPILLIFSRNIYLFRCVEASKLQNFNGMHTRLTAGLLQLSEEHYAKKCIGPVRDISVWATAFFYVDKINPQSNLMLTKQSSNNFKQQYYELKKKVELPVKLRLYFSTLEEVLERCQIRDHQKLQGNSKLLAGSFAKMSQQQKGRVILQLLRSVAETKVLNAEPSEVEVASHIETSCQLMTQTLGLSLWSDCRFKLDAQKKLVCIVHKKRPTTLNLEHYLIRKSKKHNSTIVFQAISTEVADQNKKVTVYLKETICELIYQHLFRIFLEFERLRLGKLTESEADGARLLTQGNDHGLVFLHPEKIKQYLTFKQEVLRKIRMQNLGLKCIYEKGEDSLAIDHSQKQPDIYRLRFVITGHSLGTIKSYLLSSFEHRYRYKTAPSTAIEEFSVKYKAIYDRYLVHNHYYQQLSIKEEDLQKEQIYFSMGITTTITKNRIKFLTIKVEDGDGHHQREINVVIFAGLALGTHHDTVIQFLKEFRDMMVRTQIEQTQIQIQRDQHEEEFFSIIDEQEMLTVNYSLPQDPEQHLPKHKPILLSTKSSALQSHLTHHYCLKPLQLNSGALLSKRQSSHFLFKEWKRCKNGGVVCINQEMLIEQKKIIKKIIASIGANIYKILSNGGIMTMSLPVNIFKKESHLQTIAGNFRYAPLLLENFAPEDPLTKIKRAALFVISVSNLGISSQKPFNPVLGETLQCWIAGCPLYLQQISHHPPNSAYFFQGRGYHIQGQIQSKVGIAGINTAKCWSERNNYIEFDDGIKICLIYARMHIKGILIGDRQFHFEDKVYVYDMTNLHFCQLFFGPRRKGFMAKSDPNDYIHGRIVKTTTGFLQKFKENKQKFPSAQDIALELSSIEGIWNQAVIFNGKEQFNFTHTLPYALEMDEHSLPSDSRFRKDLKEYIKGNIEDAQKEKERIEQEQRQDRKLREQAKQQQS